MQNTNNKVSSFFYSAQIMTCTNFAAQKSHNSIDMSRFQNVFENNLKWIPQEQVNNNKKNISI